MKKKKSDVKKTSPASWRSESCVSPSFGSGQVGFRAYLVTFLKLRFRELGLEELVITAPTHGGWDTTCINLYALYLILTKVRFSYMTAEDFARRLSRFCYVFYPERNIRDFDYLHWFTHLLNLSSWHRGLLDSSSH